MEIDCALEKNYVCGSDGRRYDNPCVMAARACQMRKEVTIVEFGEKCGACRQAKCERFFAECRFTDTGLATCVCPEENQCPLESDEVCANDGIAYRTECHMRANSCKNKDPLRVVKKGPCVTCKEIKCEFYGKCVKKDRKPVCQCSKKEDCPSSKNPVCGSDGKQYSSKCEMEVESCNNKRSITVKNKGVCERGQLVGFRGDGYLEYGTLSGVQKETNITMKFRPISRTGVILSNQDTGRDFIFILLKRGQVIFSYDLGKGPVEIISNQFVRLNDWNQLRVYRKDNNGYLELNGVRVNGASPLGLSQLDIDRKMFLGGIVTIQGGTGLLGVKAGFYGLMAELIINGVHYDLHLQGLVKGQPLNGVNAFYMTKGAEDMCLMTPCEHGGGCSILQNKIRCDCPKGFLGDRCQLRANVPYFQGGAIALGSAYMNWRWNLMFTTRVDVFSAVFGIRPEQNNGLIMYSGSANAFISLAIINGQIQFRFKLRQGRASTTISTDFALQLNAWSSIEAHIDIVGARVALGSLVVDSKSFTSRVSGFSTALYSSLLQERVYIGGGSTANAAIIFERTGVRAGFKGCMRDFVSEDEDLRERPLDISVSFEEGEKEDPTRLFVKVTKCGCKDQPCQNDGKCAQRKRDFRCDCKLGFTGPQCQIKSCGGNVKFDVGFAIDGSNSIDDNEYRLTKDFVKDVIKAFSISEDGTHVALLQYASKGSMEIYFDDDEYRDPDLLLKEVENVRALRGAATDIGDGLEVALKEMFSTKNGMRGNDVQKLFIFFTDGKNTDTEADLSVKANQIKNILGMTSIAVGVGEEVNRDELLTIASSEDEVFKLDEFEELKLLIDKLRPRECQGDDFP